MTGFAQALLLGILIGGVYALMASGLTLVFGVMNVINVAQGAFLIFSALVTWEVWSTTGVDPIALSLVTTPMMFLLGWVVYRLFVRRVLDAPPSATVLLTFGIALVLEGVMGLVTRNVFHSVTPGYERTSFYLGPLFLPKAYVYTFAVAVVVLSLLYVLLTHTWTGRAIRAASQNLPSAQLVGVGASSVAAMTFAIGTATTGVGGSLLAVLFTFFPASHYVWISRLLGVIVLGGMGSLPGAVLGSLILGVAEAMTSTYVSPRWATVVFYIVILVVLLFKPSGLLGRPVREDVVAA